MKELNTRQINNLITGNLMVSEISAVRENHKAFIAIQAYYPKSNGRKFEEISKYLNDGEKDRLLYRLKKCEIEEQYIDSWDTDYYMKDMGLIEDIKSIKELEVILAEYLSDLSQLDNCWAIRNPF
ncbi:MAG TPA: hypothetical protein VF941_20305 [Clostridia bacterium]